MHEPHETHHAQPWPDAPVLLAVPGCGLPEEALERAVALARARGAPLHLLRVLPRRQATLPICTVLQSLAALPAVELTVTMAEQTRAWLAQASVTAASLEVRVGELAAEAIARGRVLGAGLVVLPGTGARVGRLATRIARALRAPVLVARRHRRSDLIVAASDLRDDHYPVLHAAAELAGRLAAPMVAVHNVAPPPRLETPDPLLPVALEVSATVAERHREVLQAAVDGLEVPAEVVVSRAPHDEEAIVREASARQADLVVVGTRQGSFFSRLFTRELAARVVQRALRSVLVLPLPSAPGPG
jgi:nucleotide-binding universal stress UspA family protein